MLGSVDEVPDPQSGGGDEDEADEAVGGLVVAGGQSAAVLELGEAPLDEVSQGVEVAVDDGLGLAIALGRDDGGDAAIAQVGEDGVSVVALVAQQHLGLRAGLGHDRRVALDVGDLAAGEDHRDGQTQAVGLQMDLGREATARAAKIFILSARFFLGAGGMLVGAHDELYVRQLPTRLRKCS